MSTFKIETDTTYIDQLQTKLDTDADLSQWELFQMSYQAELEEITTSFNGLRALAYLPHVEFLPHQTECAQQVVEDMHGRAILADEVGLGKTLEAGLVLKEYMIRGLVKKALILVPASLVNQWEQELNQKFYIPAVAHRKKYAWDQCDILISSIDTAKRSPNREAIQKNEYDFILVDEAHKLKNHKTQNYEFVRSLKKKYCLLLTATPIQNKLFEIFNLVSILKPGHLGNYDSFLEQYGKDQKQVQQDAYLKQLIQKVMVRHRRQDTDLENTKRHIETAWVQFSEDEARVYQSLNDTPFTSAFTKVTLLRELCSSREACFLSLQKMTESTQATPIIQELIEQIEQLPHHAKANKVIELLEAHPEEKMIIFTEYRATQLYLQWYLQQHHITSVPYRGGFKRSKKDWMRNLFEHHAQVLIATEAGGEGINLQFCHYMINYDLPWNPMRLEQRIGRIHRYGQEQDVHIYNIVTEHTIEERIMTLLYEKINLFEHVIGDLDRILSKLSISNLEDEITTIFSESASMGETKIKLDNLSSVIESEHHQTKSEAKADGY